jgi:hypothetical protein
VPGWQNLQHCEYAFLTNLGPALTIISTRHAPAPSHRRLLPARSRLHVKALLNVGLHTLALKDWSGRSLALPAARRSSSAGLDGSRGCGARARSVALVGKLATALAIDARGRGGEAVAVQARLEARQTVADGAFGADCRWERKECQMGSENDIMEILWEMLW